MRRILLGLSMLLLLASWGCFLKKKSSVTPPAPAPSPSPESAPPAVTPPPLARQPAPLESAPLLKKIDAPSSLELGEVNFQAGNYPQAAKEFEAFLSANPDSRNRDQALFRLGLSRALAGDSGRDLRQAEAAFRRLVSEFPNSRYKSRAEFILGLQAQIDKLRSEMKERDEKIKKLSEELQVLKEIDLQRRPSRPPE